MMRAKAATKLQGEVSLEFYFRSTRHELNGAARKEDQDTNLEKEFQKPFQRH